METRCFQATMQTDDESAFFLEVPAEVMAALGKRKRPPVAVTLNGYLHRTTVAVYGGKYYLPVRKEIRQAAGLAPGDAVAVTIALDAEPRAVDLPEDFARDLAANTEAQSAFDRLSYSHRKEYVDWIAAAKRDDTRRRRVEKALTMLAEGRKEPTNDSPGLRTR